MSTIDMQVVPEKEIKKLLTSDLTYIDKKERSTYDSGFNPLLA